MSVLIREIVASAAAFHNVRCLTETGGSVTMLVARLPDV
jgi:hypothetical protein